MHLFGDKLSHTAVHLKFPNFCGGATNDIAFKRRLIDLQDEIGQSRTECGEWVGGRFGEQFKKQEKQKEKEKLLNIVIIDEKQNKHLKNLFLFEYVASLQEL